MSTEGVVVVLLIVIGGAALSAHAGQEARPAPSPCTAYVDCTGVRP